MTLLFSLCHLLQLDSIIVIMIYNYINYIHPTLNNLIDTLSYLENRELKIIKNCLSISKNSYIIINNNILRKAITS